MLHIVHVVTAAEEPTTRRLREVALTRVDQGWETERFEVGIGEPHREGFAPAAECPLSTTDKEIALSLSVCPKTYFSLIADNTSLL
jgi:hypothetical protein